jgi:hypothetical protein
MRTTPASPVGRGATSGGGATLIVAANAHTAQCDVRSLSRGTSPEPLCFAAQQAGVPFDPGSSTIPRAWPGIMTLKNNASTSNRTIVNPRRIRHHHRVSNQFRQGEMQAWQYDSESEGMDIASPIFLMVLLTPFANSCSRAACSPLRRA